MMIPGTECRGCGVVLPPHNGDICSPKCGRIVEEHDHKMRAFRREEAKAKNAQQKRDGLAARISKLERTVAQLRDESKYW